MAKNTTAKIGLVFLAITAANPAMAGPNKAHHIRSKSYVAYDRSDIGYVYGGIGIGRAAFPIPGAIPAGTLYDPYRMPFSYDWPYGYGSSGL